MSWEKDTIDRELCAVRKELSRYRLASDSDMVAVLEHLEMMYNLLHTLYKKRR